MDFNIAKLSEIAEIISGQSPPSSTYNNLGKGIPFFQGKADFGKKHPKVRYWCTKPTKISVPNDILMSVRAPVGPIIINNLNACIGRGIGIIRVNQNVSLDYIYYYLKINEKKIASLGVGSTFKAISQKDLKQLEILIPKNPNDQIRIAEILTQAENLITLRKESIALLDELLKSTFLEMFEDYLFEGNLMKLNDICFKITDGTHDTPIRLTEGIKFITGKHIKPFVIDYENSDYVTTEVHEDIYKRCNPEYGDILYTNIGVNLGTAAMNVVNYEFSMKNVALLKPKREKINSRYLEHILNNDRQKNKIINDNSSGGAQKFLSLGQIKSIKIPVPPIELQNRFAHIVEKVEALKSYYQASLNELENMYGVLSQKAFKGELKVEDYIINEELGMVAETKTEY